MLLTWVLVIVGIVAIVRWFFPRSEGGKPAAEENPLDILKRRYAKGDIGQAEFEERKKVILGS